MSGISKSLGKFAVSSNLINSSIQKSGSGLGTFSKRSMWEPIGKGLSSKDKEYKLSTMAYEKKLQNEEELRTQTKAFQVPMSQIVKQLPKRTTRKVIYNEL